MQKLEYSGRYYQSIFSDSERSAREVAPLLFRLFSPRSLVDVGCGCGTWTRALKDSGVKEVLGVDGEVVRLDQLRIAPEEFLRRDLASSLRLDRRFDMALSLEVAEHLPAARAESLVADLCGLSDVVVFSAAVPGQGGTHHINEQWPSYWITRFGAAGYAVVDCVRWQIWNNPNVAWWYRQNAFVFIKRDRLATYSEAVALGSHRFPYDAVHPEAYVTATVPADMSPRMLKNVLQAMPHFPGKVLRHFKKASASTPA